MTKFWPLFVWCVLFSVFVVKSSIFLDPDFGWHYQMGKVITQTGIPPTDPFSYTIPDFKYIDHEWLTNVLMHKLFNGIGYFGMSVLWSSVMVTILYISTLKTKNSLIKIGLVIAGAGLMMGQFGIRPQVISWLYFTVLFWILTNWQQVKKIKYVLPLFFLLWANMHGMFLLGIVILGVYLTVKSFRIKKIDLLDVLILIASILITLINPYGINLWKEVLSTFFDATSRAEIAEWKPVWTRLNIMYPVLTSLGFAFIYRYKKVIALEFSVLFLMLFLMSVNSAISLPLFGIVALFVTVNGMEFLENEIKVIKYGKIRFVKATQILVGLCVGLYLFSVIKSYMEAYKLSEDVFYPKQSVNYISQNLPSGEVFSQFNWGGYLIWKLPQKKVFVDGRMVHWNGILDNQTSLINGETDYVEVFKKYNIQTVLWPKNTAKEKFITKLKSDGWVVVFSDPVSEVLEKNPKE